MNEALVAVSGLSVGINGLTAVEDVEFVIKRGERVGIIGESGCGKTLTALAIAGLLPRSFDVAGEILLNGHRLDKLPEGERRRWRGSQIGFIFQDPHSALDPTMRIGRQVAEPLRVHTGKPYRKTRQRVYQLLRDVGLEPAPQRAAAYPHELSGGQKQRAMIAAAIACGPALLIADEPTTALDTTVQKRVLDQLDKVVGESTSLLLISHDIGVIRRMCSRVYVMYGGRVVEHGNTAAIVAEPQHPYTTALLAAATLKRTAADDGGSYKTVRGTVPALGEFPTGCHFRDRCERADSACSTEPALEGMPHSVRCWYPNRSEA
jgi:peptide/nickel transport system ATP-binding protein